MGERIQIYKNKFDTQDFRGVLDTISYYYKSPLKNVKYKRVCVFYKHLKAGKQMYLQECDKILQKKQQQNNNSIYINYTRHV